jgi:2,4-dienoyl-CoA reductase-like NADH-dependent reductase (Old Yellow Enzyme family)
MLAAELPAAVAEADTEDSALRLGSQLRRAGCDIIAASGTRSERGHDGRLRITELLRLELGIPTLVFWPMHRLDEAAGELLAGRFDLVSPVANSECSG